MILHIVLIFLLFAHPCLSFLSHQLSIRRNDDESLRRAIPGNNDNSDSKILISDTSYTPTKPTVWSVFGELATKTNAANLGQGFPDWDPPDFVTDAFQSVAKSTYHQYTRPSGHIPLVELIGERYSRHLQTPIDPINNIVITVGASQALYLTLMNFLGKDDEIVLFEPFFDLYLKQIKLIGAMPKFVPLGGASATLDDPWALDLDLLRRQGSILTGLISC
jgi:aspartate/methionine/tyrosine aminotransferase